eukprot:scaffold226534_cov35-Tisochrysis_lutea.AAC.2
MRARAGADASGVTSAAISRSRSEGRRRWRRRESASPGAPDGRGARCAKKKSDHFRRIDAICGARGSSGGKRELAC